MRNRTHASQALRLLTAAGLAGVVAAILAGCGTTASSGGLANTAKTLKGGGAQTAGGNTVKVGMTDFKFAVNPPSIAAGKVKFVATNSGKVVHEMVVIKTARQASDLGTGKRVSEAGSVGEIGELEPGASGSKTLDLKPGHYALICNVSGHYMAGMYADLTVK